MNTAFSSDARLLYTSATVAKPSLSRTISGVISAIADEEESSIEEDRSTCGSVDEDEACGRGLLEEKTGMVEDDMAEDDHSGESCSDDDAGFQE